MSRLKSKENRNKNKPYTDYKSTLKSAKQFLENYDCNCPRKCREALSVEKEKEEYVRFWSLGSYNFQTGSILCLVKKIPKK